MEMFLANAATLPTAVFTLFIIVLMGYWCLAIFGMVDIDVIDLDIDLDADVKRPSRYHRTDVQPRPDRCTGDYRIDHIVFRRIHPFLLRRTFRFTVYFKPDTARDQRSVIGTVSFAVSLPLTAIIIRPLKKLFAKLDAQTASKTLLGVTCTVRSSRADKDFGEAECQVDCCQFINQSPHRRTDFQQR